ncbi:4-(cytidine 5'-diphospho)-2-C-methyl-D-erythritol kinase [Marinicella sp. S1101]|uniref:4-(cytidine 5'-diphospho)-2-C-methyl-D-erythritol kinase n=1 Tax=Marinicella marina TaxID=2996016 RepID=UPI002260CD91|nr:4-(cytidine 5'-diphospho)-2-C-methyl-D-erythritol kinase [Marinicella marina]MCX7552967.1 4-(cytidine 5'-diphospho)-2-C-methyl-D-erythritol kinase [Marinicella marina]MDJ1139723.1 4-(cytidine 5'-diphospho)-2-C-methyl-D-erythritol kinase [Marinicella marina]
MELVTHTFLSPAKINLMLRILGQRQDGYHELQTCFQILNWGDEIQFKPFTSAEPNAIKITGFERLKPEDNLIHKAAQLLKPLANNTTSWQLAVTKNIPMGAGLGGGSSNAAVVLKFLNDAWQCGMHEKALAELGVRLGADVPVFLSNSSAVATGIGDVLVPTAFNTPHILLLFPETSISTSEMFKHKALNRSQATLKASYLQRPSFWINDFFPLVLKTNHEVNNVYQKLSPSMPIRLSGSGSTLFVLFDDISAAEDAYRLAKCVCKAVLTKPLAKEA